MKNFIITFFSLFVVSCSSNDSPTEDNTEGAILKNYKEYGEYGNIHLFDNEGTRYDKITRSKGEIFIDFSYDSNNRMTEIAISPDSSPVTTTFTYNSNDQIIKMEKDSRKAGTAGKLFVWLFTHNKNVVTGELVSSDDPNFNHVKVQYTFNDEGLLISKHNYVDYPAKENRPIRTTSYETLKYDKNKNLISLKMSTGGTHDLPDSPANLYAESVTYEYDDKINPVNQAYMNHYVNYILSNEFPFVLERGSIQDHVAGTGKNNLIKTNYPVAEFGGIPIDNVYKNTYNYQLNNLPRSMSRISTEDNKEYGGLTFNYSVK
ncbi:hypothetical protein D3C87_843360 [compost metagenome]